MIGLKRTPVDVIDMYSLTLWQAPFCIILGKLYTVYSQ